MGTGTSKLKTEIKRCTSCTPQSDDDEKIREDFVGNLISRKRWWNHPSENLPSFIICNSPSRFLDKQQILCRALEQVKSAILVIGTTEVTNLAVSPPDLPFSQDIMEKIRLVTLLVIQSGRIVDCKTNVESFARIWSCISNGFNPYIWIPLAAACGFPFVLYNFRQILKVIVNHPVWYCVMKFLLIDILWPIFWPFYSFGCQIYGIFGQVLCN